jgi:hypothetical protein
MVAVECLEPTANVFKFLHNLSISPFGPVVGEQEEIPDSKAGADYQRQNLANAEVREKMGG